MCSRSFALCPHPAFFRLVWFSTIYASVPFHKVSPLLAHQQYPPQSTPTTEKNQPRAWPRWAGEGARGAPLLEVYPKWETRTGQGKQRANVHQVVLAVEFPHASIPTTLPVPSQMQRVAREKPAPSPGRTSGQHGATQLRVPPSPSASISNTVVSDSKLALATSQNLFQIKQK